MNGTGTMSAPISGSGPSRRLWLQQSLLVCGGVALGAGRAEADSSQEISRSAESIHQEVSFQATAKQVYEALTVAARFQKVEALSAAASSVNINAPAAEISREAGGGFSLFGSYIVGRQIELVENQRIVEAWRVGSWDPGAYSIAHFELTEQGRATTLVFDHTGFPAGMADHLAAGWHANYWEPLKKYLAQAG
jgi:activator of HSP90 ATPase